jgi:hypothetical protein
MRRDFSRANLADVAQHLCNRRHDQDWRPQIRFNRPLKLPRIVPFSFLSHAENGQRVATTTMNSHFIDVIATINTISAGNFPAQELPHAI